jgi:hypothetical protein
MRPHAYSSLEFDFRVLGDGRSASARYANNSNYRNDSLIRKESKFVELRFASSTDERSVRERCYGRRNQAHRQGK